MRIIKNDHSGKKVWEYDGEIIEQSESALLLKAVFNRSNVLFDGVLFREGDCFLELYPFNKWFNIYEIHDKDNDLVKGWYCNVTRPAQFSVDQISYDDLALDLLVYPDREMLLLDQDEFSELSLSSTEVINAKNGLHQLQNIFSQPDAFQMRTYKDFV
ncbi:MAG: DUF402 domain-containing protein [Pelolinea sp.]|nr:DUF402 domain-containing protein [Pelolinea sp.]